MVTEVPVPLSNVTTRERFMQALTKAKLIYDTVIPHEKYQYALLGDSYNKQTGIVYTSSKDKKIYVKKIAFKAEEVYMNRMRELKAGFMKVGTYSNSNGLRYGVISHTGEVILQPVYCDVEDVQKKFLICEDDTYTKADLCDYDGNIWINGRNNMNDILYCSREKGLIISGHKAYMIRVDRLFQSGTEVQIYMVYQGELYSTIQCPRKVKNRRVKTVVGTNSLVVHLLTETNGEGQRMIIPAEKLLQSAHKVEIGKQPTFIHINFENSQR